MQKEMTRQEFLTTLGFGVASLLGFSGVLKMLSGKSLGGNGHRSSFGYGNSSYGGGNE